LIRKKPYTSRQTYIMPKEEVFARVIHGGIISEGDTIRVRNVG
jgi:MOSC domain-containing protein YiiM